MVNPAGNLFTGNNSGFHGSCLCLCARVLLAGNQHPGLTGPQVSAVSHTQQHPHTRWPLWVQLCMRVPVPQGSGAPQGAGSPSPVTLSPEL